MILRFFGVKTNQSRIQMSAHSLMNNTTSWSTINSVNFVLFWLLSTSSCSPAILTSLEYLITFNSCVFLLTIQDEQIQNYCRSCLNFLFKSQSNQEMKSEDEGSAWDTWKSLKEVSNHKAKEHFIIELNAQPSFIIFSYLFTPRLVLLSDVWLSRARSLVWI